MRRYLCSIMQLSQAFSRRYLGNHFSAIRARHSRGLHISRSPMPFARPTSVHPIAIINEFCYRLFSLFFPSLILLSHSVIILLLLFLPRSYRSPSLEQKRRRICSFSYRTRCLSPTPLREKLDFRPGVSNSFLRPRITGRKFNLTSITGSDTRRNHA